MGLNNLQIGKAKIGSLVNQLIHAIVKVLYSHFILIEIDLIETAGLHTSLHTGQ